MINVEKVGVSNFVGFDNMGHFYLYSYLMMIDVTKNSVILSRGYKTLGLNI